MQHNMRASSALVELVTTGWLLELPIAPASNTGHHVLGHGLRCNLVLPTWPDLFNLHAVTASLCSLCNPTAQVQPSSVMQGRSQYAFVFLDPAKFR